MAALYASGNKRYRAPVNRSFSRMPQNNSFVSRGGLWVLAQVPLMLLVLVVPMRFDAGRFLPADPVQMLGVAITVLGASLIVWGFISLGEALTPFPQPLKEAVLHRQGAYRLMRHPIYSGVLLAGFGWARWWLSAGGALCVLLLAVFFDRKAAYEERWLRQKYSEYADYARAVKKFIPGLY
jgi:protein-S-isoprenylcysteine O-methyltransferase Ste14